MFSFLNPFDRILKRAARRGVKTILIPWNRGLGDIALGLYALTQRVRDFLPDAQITFLTRPDLREGFSLLENVDVLVAPHWKRGEPFLKVEGVVLPATDLVLEKVDPTRWLSWQLGKLVPKLRWKSEWDSLSDRFALPKGCLCVHVQTETRYAYEKNWPLHHWRALFESLSIPIVLFGMEKNPSFVMKNVIDLRGETSLIEMLSIIKNYASQLLVPDSGVLSLSYFLDISFPIKVISLWADPRQGVLKQNVPSPNSELVHIPLIAPEEDLSKISVQEVLQWITSS